MDEKEYLAAAEAILFSMGDSVSLTQIAKALEIDEERTKAVLETLRQRYEDDACGIQVIELDGSYQLCTKPKTYEPLIRVAKQPVQYVLTDVLLETLSIVAYKQPITRVQIENIRGVSCDHAVNKLLDFGLICELGRLDAPGRPIVFGTTEEFLRCFSVHSVDDLPAIREELIEEFTQEVSSELPRQPEEDAVSELSKVQE